MNTIIQTPVAVLPVPISGPADLILFVGESVQCTAPYFFCCLLFLAQTSSYPSFGISGLHYLEPVLIGLFHFFGGHDLQYLAVLDRCV